MQLFTSEVNEEGNDAVPICTYRVLGTCQMACHAATLLQIPTNTVVAQLYSPKLVTPSRYISEASLATHRIPASQRTETPFSIRRICAVGKWIATDFKPAARRVTSKKTKKTESKGRQETKRTKRAIQKGGD